MAELLSYGRQNARCVKNYADNNGEQHEHEQGEGFSLHDEPDRHECDEQVKDRSDPVPNCVDQILTWVVSERR